MNISATDRVLVGITVTIVTVAAGAVHLWLGFIALLGAAVVLVALKRLLGGRVSADKPLYMKAATPNLVINPATGMPMSGAIDAGGNLYGQNEACGTNVYGRHEG